MNTLYLECYSGISGDMTVAALLDLGADQTVLEKALQSLSIDGFSIKISHVKKSGLDVCDFHVILDQDNHDHDMEYLHPHTDHHTDLSHPKDPKPDDSCMQISTDPLSLHTGHTHTHTHRSLSDILSIIQNASLTDHAKQLATKIFTILGEAEAKAHGTSLEQVHFHEVGAVDSIVDIISVAVCLDNLNITNVIIPQLWEGCGTIHCQHGILPVPVPAVVNIIQKYQIPLQITHVQGEFVTPTGAAIAAAIRNNEQLPEQFQIQRIGLGAGKRIYEQPGILRAMLIAPCCSTETKYDADVIYKLETNLDDCTGEMMGSVMERLMQAGARDVCYLPVYMKKNRPAYQLNVLCEKSDISRLEQIIFSQTTTIGIRRQRMERSILPRKTETLNTIYGNIQVKICEIESCKRIYPEYESVIQICQQTGQAFPETYRKLLELCYKQCL